MIRSPPKLRHSDGMAAPVEPSATLRCAMIAWMVMAEAVPRKPPLTRLFYPRNQDYEKAMGTGHGVFRTVAFGFRFGRQLGPQGAGFFTESAMING
jgi:hypothetical protein